MNDSSIIDSLLKDNYFIIVNIVTVEELDNLKTNKDYEKAKQARHAIRAIEKNKEKIQFNTSRTINSKLVIPQGSGTNFNLNDDIIVSCASLENAILLTNDLNLKIKAELIGVKSLDYKDYSMYYGYVEYVFTEEEFNDYFEHRQEHFSDYYINEYIIINMIDTNKSIEYRFDGNDLVLLKLPSSKFIKAKNALQRCVLDMLLNNDIDICAVLGTMGSGKTFLSLQMAVNAIKTNSGKQSQIMGIRSPIGTGREIGYLKGDMNDKIGAFFTPLADSLNGKEYEVQEMTDKGQLETNIPYYCKGRTFDSTIVVADEAEDLTEQEIRLIGTRLGENSRIFFSGDYKQSEINKSNSNPLVKMCEEFKGNSRFACVYLQDDVRSEASKMFATLFD